MEGGSLLISHEKYIKDGKVLVHLGIKSKLLPGPLTDLSAWVGLTSAKGRGNTFDLNPKWSRTLPSLIYVSWDIYRDPLHKVFFQISKLIFDTLLWA
jgi:hypothetical protein